VVVVVSAMAGETDRLISLARDLTPEPDERELDRLLSSGEQVATSLMVIALKGLGYPARPFVGRRVGIVTDSSHTNARIRSVSAVEISSALQEGMITVVAGFQGVDENQDVTTLGRGGSDLTAVALAAALGADRCQICTDVNGVYTADPHLVPAARQLDRVSYDEMLEMASLGAKVLQARSVEVAKKYNVALEVMSSFEEGKGTLVTREDADMERAVVSAVNCDSSQAKVTIEGLSDRPGIAGQLFGALANAGVVVDMIVQNVASRKYMGSRRRADISFTVPVNVLSQAQTITQGLVREIGARRVRADGSIAKVSIVGIGMKTHTGVASKMFQTLAEHKINVLMISTSEIVVSCVIEADHAEVAVRALHDAFELEKG
jgi:aspartate kinase